jgi:hypothetical protein
MMKAAGDFCSNCTCFLRQGSEEAMTADAKALAILNDVAQRVGTPSSIPATSVPQIVHSFHKSKDKHVFRVLASICDPTHSVSARSRALDELPKRTRPLGDDVSKWVRHLVDRLAMGSFLNIEVVNHCLLLAQEAFAEEDYHVASGFLACIKLAARSCPSIIRHEKAFETVAEMFSDSRSKQASDDGADKFGILTTLSYVLAAASSSHSGQEQVRRVQRPPLAVIFLTVSSLFCHRIERACR